MAAAVEPLIRQQLIDRREKLNIAVGRRNRGYLWWV